MSWRAPASDTSGWGANLQQARPAAVFPAPYTEGITLVREEISTMQNKSSRRAFLTGAVAVPAVSSAAASTAALRTLGKTGLKVTPLGFGCMLVSDASVVARALDMGVNFFDTARSYQGGNNERMVGAALKGRRKEVILESKTMSRDKDSALRDLDTSLKELGADYLDIWHLHSISTPAELNDGMLEAQRVAKQQGKIRFAGVSMHFGMKEMIPHLAKLGQTDVVLCSYNFSMPAAMEMEATLEAAAKAGIGVIAMKVMAGGFARIQRGDRLYENSPQALTERLKKPGAMPAALKWALRNPNVATAIVGVTDDEELEADFEAARSPYGEEDRRLLAAQLDCIGPLYCRTCGSCSGSCRMGLPVSDILRVLSYADGYGQFPLARQRFLELPAKVRMIRCAACEGCTVRCPNGVEVRARLTRAQQWLA